MFHEHYEMKSCFGGKKVNIFRSVTCSNNFGHHNVFFFVLLTEELLTIPLVHKKLKSLIKCSKNHMWLMWLFHLCSPRRSAMPMVRAAQNNVARTLLQLLCCFVHSMGSTLQLATVVNTRRGQISSFLSALFIQLACCSQYKKVTWCHTVYAYNITIATNVDMPTLSESQSWLWDAKKNLYSAFNNTDCVKALNSIKLEDRVSVMYNNKIKHSIFS